ncbi:calcium-binding protein [Actinoplanes sp. LDG1-06]|uniref:Calcium-binding protein n=1 Tax=Paractinoplanes ovalisporus TaxID=2810368 RepID=A0ABS2ABE8_9ACTN|nr:calcium-binding protein [Actinoplanes ovalisporus]MBM2617133.1 calcium-binding protein [Actinoplanes ovalisporus]
MTTFLRTGIAVVAGGLLTVGLSVTPAQAAAPKGVVSVERATVVAYVSDPAKAHNVVLTRSGRTVTVDDVVAIRAGSGCAAVSGDSTKVRCTLKVNPTWARVVLGGLSDTLVNKTDLHLSAKGGAGNDRITGGPGNDLLDGSIGDDAIWGMGGNDTIDGWHGRNALSGGDGNDVITGGNDADRLYGGNGDDSLNAFAGNDIEDGGPGDDHIFQNMDPIGFADADAVIGGTGYDTVHYDARSRPVIADADAVKGDDGMAGEKDTLGTSVEAILGGNGNDRLIGTPRADSLHGGPGNDVLAGSSGDDVLEGGPGNDYVNGAGGFDQCLREGQDTILNCEELP